MPCSTNPSAALLPSVVTSFTTISPFVADKSLTSSFSGMHNPDKPSENNPSGATQNARFGLGQAGRGLTFQLIEFRNAVKVDTRVGIAQRQGAPQFLQSILPLKRMSLGEGTGPEDFGPAC